MKPGPPLSQIREYANPDNGAALDLAARVAAICGTSGSLLDDIEALCAEVERLMALVETLGGSPNPERRSG